MIARSRSEARETANSVARIARALVWIWLVLSLIGCGVLATQTPDGSSDWQGVTGPFVLLAAAIALLIGIIATFMLAVIEYVVYRTTSD